MGENAQVPVLDGGRWLLIPGEDGVDEQAAAARTDRANVPMGSDQAEAAALDCSRHQFCTALAIRAAASSVMPHALVCAHAICPFERGGRDALHSGQRPVMWASMRPLAIR